MSTVVNLHVLTTSAGASWYLAATSSAMFAGRILAQSRPILPPLAAIIIVPAAATRWLTLVRRSRSRLNWPPTEITTEMLPGTVRPLRAGIC